MPSPCTTATFPFSTQKLKWHDKKTFRKQWKGRKEWDTERKKRKDQIPTKNEYQNNSNFMGLNSPFIFNDEGVRTILAEMVYTYIYLYTLSYPNFLSLSLSIRILMLSFIVCVRPGHSNTTPIVYCLNRRNSVRINAKSFFFGNRYLCARSSAEKQWFIAIFVRDTKMTSWMDSPFSRLWRLIYWKR